MTAPIRSYDDLIAALRGRMAELQVTFETVDGVSGLQSGYSAKLLGPTPIKNFGRMSFEAILGALGVALVVVPDQEAIARVQSRWTKRERPLKNAPASIAASMPNEVPAIMQITPALQAQLINHEHMKRIAKLGAKARNKVMKKRARQRAATHAARKRWDKRGREQSA